MILTTKNISYSFNYISIINNFNIKISTSDIVHLKGANGSGKSSILKILAKIKTPLSGNIIYSEKFLENSFYLSDINPINKELNSIDNIFFLVNLKNNCTKYNISKKLVSLGLENIIYNKIKYLSSGQQKLVSLCTLFFIKAKLWLLDEPFNNLDEKNIFFFEK